MSLNMDAVLKITANVVGENNIRRLGNSMQGLEGKIKNASLATDLLYSGIKGLAALAVTGGIVALAKSAIDLADDMRDLSQRTGVGIQTLGQFKVAAELSGTSLEGVANGLKFLNKNLVDAATGGDKAAAAFKTIGVATTEANGTLRSADKVFLDIADQFAQMRDGPEKAALAMKVLGKSGQELIPILNLGSKEIQRFGLGIGPDFANKADAFNDQLGLMKAQATVLTVQIGSALLPVMSGLMSIVSQGAVQLGNLTVEFYKAIGGAAGLQQAAALLTKTMVVLGGVTAGVFVATNLTTFAAALRGVVGVMRTMLTIERAMLAIETARVAVVGVIAGIKSGKTPASAAIGGIIGGGAAGIALIAGVSKLIDDITRRISSGVQSAFNVPNIPNQSQGVIPDIQGLDTGKAKSAKDKASEIADALAASRESYYLERDSLRVLKEKDPIRKIELDYLGKERALLARLASEYSKAKSGEQQRFIEREKSVALRKLEILRANELKEANDALFKKTYSFLDDDVLGAEGLNRITTGASELKRVFSTSIDLSGNPLSVELRRVRLELEELLNPINQVTSAAKSIGEAFGESFKGLVSGSMTAQESLANLFKGIADSFMNMAAQMISKWIEMQILGLAQSFFPGAKGGFISSVFSPSGIGAGGNLGSSFGFANGAAFAQNGIQPFAMGGIVDRPTMFRFANGGAGNLGLMGEAGPEAILPLKRGANGKLGVAGGGGVSVGAININVENTGEQLSPAAQKQIATQVQGIVLSTIANQKRSGGMLR